MVFKNFNMKMVIDMKDIGFRIKGTERGLCFFMMEPIMLEIGKFN